jgi:hypothetical protein
VSRSLFEQTIPGYALETYLTHLTLFHCSDAFSSGTPWGIRSYPVSRMMERLLVIIDLFSQMLISDYSVTILVSIHKDIVWIQFLPFLPRPRHLDLFGLSGLPFDIP